jgi:hypothetical protein
LRWEENETGSKPLGEGRRREFRIWDREKNSKVYLIREYDFHTSFWFLFFISFLVFSNLFF